MWEFLLSKSIISYDAASGSIVFYYFFNFLLIGQYIVQSTVEFFLVEVGEGLLFSHQLT